MTRFALLAALAMLMPLPLHAASFDCAKASTTVETIVCADPALSQLDEDMDAAYRETMEIAVNRGGVWGMQKDWHTIMSKKCKDAACVKADYEVQLAALKNYRGEEYSANYKTAIENSLTLGNMTKAGFDFTLVQSNIDTGEATCKPPEAARTAIYTGPAHDKAVWSEQSCTITFAIDRGKKKTDNTVIDIVTKGCKFLCPANGAQFDDHYITSYEPVAANQ